MAKVCDCFPELKATTEAREMRYRAHPEKPAPEGPQSSVEIRVTSIGQLNELVETKKSGHKFIISEPVHVGGQNCAPTPLEFLLSGAVGCYAAVFAFYAAKMGVRYDSFEAVARTSFDVRGHMMPDAPPSGFQKVTIDITVRSDARWKSSRKSSGWRWRVAPASPPCETRWRSSCASRSPVRQASRPHSVADLTFLSALRRVDSRNVKSKATLKS